MSKTCLKPLLVFVWQEYRLDLSLPSFANFVRQGKILFYDFKKKISKS